MRSNVTATMMKVPMNAPCQKALMPSRPRLLRITSISAEPISAPNGGADAAGEVGAADDSGSDDLQLHAGAEIGGHGAEPPGFDDAGEAGRQRRDHVDRDLDPAHRNAGQDRGLLVAADREHVAAEAGPAQHEAGDQRQDHHVDDRVGDPERGAAAERKAACRDPARTGRRRCCWRRPSPGCGRSTASPSVTTNGGMPR